MIQLIVDGSRQPLRKDFIFNGGEVHIEINSNNVDKDVEEVIVMAYLKDANGIMRLAMVKDACERQYPNAVIKLSMPYVPYARQDRVNANGEALGAKVFCEMINNMCFAEVTICDPHSDVVSALLDDVVVESQSDIFIQHMAQHPVSNSLRKGETIILAPDAGAVKKAAKLAKHYGAEVIVGEKVRDTATGEITGTVIHDPKGLLKNKPKVVMVDDICDGGRTFTELTRVLRDEFGVENIGLYVTHGIFSQGKSCLHRAGITWVVSPFDWEHHAITGQSFQ